MFSGFWGWFLVVVIVAAIFGAGKLPELKKVAEDKLKVGLDAVQKGKKDIEAKIAESKMHKEESKKTEIKENKPEE